MLAMSACTQKPKAVGDQATLNAIADRCGLARSTFDLRANRDLHFKPPAGSKYEAVDCALREIQKSGIPFKMGFIGNEAYVGNKQ
jgi:hypothetical protein